MGLGDETTTLVVCFLKASSFVIGSVILNVSPSIHFRRVSPASQVLVLVRTALVTP